MIPETPSPCGMTSPSVVFSVFLACHWQLCKFWEWIEKVCKVVAVEGSRFCSEQPAAGHGEGCLKSFWLYIHLMVLEGLVDCVWDEIRGWFATTTIYFKVTLLSLCYANVTEEFIFWHYFCGFGVWLVQMFFTVWLNRLVEVEFRRPNIDYYGFVFFC